jgi:hypothetical protein
MAKKLSLRAMAARRGKIKTVPKRGRGRPPGAKNKPRELPADSPYLTIPMYCRPRGISLATFYAKHRDDLEVVKFDRALLITKTSAAERDRRCTQQPRRKADDGPRAATVT